MKTAHSVEWSLGYSAAVNGANTTNCHFGLFSSREKTREWERGKAFGDELLRFQRERRKNFLAASHLSETGRVDGE